MLSDDPPMAVWRLLADGVVLLHASYVAFVVFGLFAIAIGGVLGAGWVRNLRFRALHLAAMALVFLEMLTNITCPLTVLEDDLRRRAGESAYPGDFISYWTHRLIFFSWPPWVFDALYTGTMLAIIVLLLVVPPDLHVRRAER